MSDANLFMPLLASALDPNNDGFIFGNTTDMHTGQERKDAIIHVQHRETILRGEFKGQPATHRFRKIDGTLLDFGIFIKRFVADGGKYDDGIFDHPQRSSAMPWEKVFEVMVVPAPPVAKPSKTSLSYGGVVSGFDDTRLPSSSPDSDLCGSAEDGVAVVEETGAAFHYVNEQWLASAMDPTNDAFSLVKRAKEGIEIDMIHFDARFATCRITELPVCHRFADKKGKIASPMSLKQNFVRYVSLCL
jgi:hypothetical protein